MSLKISFSRTLQSNILQTHISKSALGFTLVPGIYLEMFSSFKKLKTQIAQEFKTSDQTLYSLFQN